MLAFLRMAVASALIGASFVPASARARERRASRLQLEWHAPAGCLDRDAARAAIDEALGDAPAARDARSVARVHIAQLPDGRWNADIWMYGAHGSGERSFAGASCVHVAEAAALIVAMALDPATAAERAARGPHPPSAAMPATATRFSAGVRASGDVGSLPEPSAGAGLALGVEHGVLLADLEAMAWLPQVARGEAPPGTGGRFGLFTLGVRGCVDALAGASAALQLGPCLGAEAGLATGRGIDISDPADDEHLWAAGLGGVTLRHRGPSQLRLELRVEAGLPLRRPTWEIEEIGEVFRASPVLGRASLALIWLFP